MGACAVNEIKEVQETNQHLVLWQMRPGNQDIHILNAILSKIQLREG